MTIENRLTKIEEKLGVNLSGSSLYTLNSASIHDDEIDLRELWCVVWQGKWIIISLVLAFSVASVIYVKSMPNIYKAQALLAPSEESKGGGMAALAGKFGGLASLAGVNLGGGGMDSALLAMEVMKSRQFIAAFIESYDLLVPIMAAESWDMRRNQLVINPKIYDESSHRWLRQVAPPKEPKPSSGEAYKKFTEIFSVSQNQATSLITVSIEYYSPELAREWAANLVKEINIYMREHDVAQAMKSIQYLTEKLNSTAVADMRMVFSQMIEEQTKIMMLAEVRDEYVFSTIDPAVAPEQKVKPKRALICVLGVILGGMLGLVIVAIRHFVNPEKKEIKEAELEK